MDVHPPKNGIYRYWSIAIYANLHQKTQSCERWWCILECEPPYISPTWICMMILDIYIYMYYMMELTHTCGWIGHLPDKTRMRMCPVLLAVRAREISRLLLLGKVQKQIETNITCWWYTYPSQKWWSSSNWIIIPTLGENKKCLKLETTKQNFYVQRWTKSSTFPWIIGFWVGNLESSLWTSSAFSMVFHASECNVTVTLKNENKRLSWTDPNGFVHGAMMGYASFLSEES